MKRLGETSPFHRFTNPRRDKSVYFWSWGSYLLSTVTLMTECMRRVRDGENQNQNCYW